MTPQSLHVEAHSHAGVVVGVGSLPLLGCPAQSLAQLSWPHDPGALNVPMLLGPFVSVSQSSTGP